MEDRKLSVPGDALGESEGEIGRVRHSEGACAMGLQDELMERAVNQFLRFTIFCGFCASHLLRHRDRLVPHLLLFQILVHHEVNLLPFMVFLLL